MKGAKKAASGPAPPTDRPLSVGSLASIIDEALIKGLPKTVKVLGEISGFTDRTHCYFDLKDEQAVISCVMFAGAARKLAFKPASGLQVVAKGRISFYPKQGRTQLYVDSMTPAGEGPLELELRRLVAELKPEHRALLERTLEGEVEYQTLAREFALPVGTVRSRLHRARNELRRRLESTELQRSVA